MELMKNGKWFQLNTLKKRMMLMMGIGVFLCILMLILISYGSIQAMQQTRIETAITEDFSQQSRQLVQDYYSLIHISQQMMPQGGIGSAVNQYLEADVQYDRISLSRQISESLSVLTYSNQRNLLATYLQPGEKEERFLFANLPLRDGVDIVQFPVLATNSELTFHGIHLSQSRISTDDVISIASPVILSDGKRRTIYVEATTSILQSFASVSEAQKVPRYFLQIDAGNTIRYSNAEDYPIGGKINLSKTMKNKENIGKIGKYIWMREPMPFALSNILLIPEDSYNRELYTWITGVVLVVGFTVAVLAITIVLLLRLIYHPLQLLTQEIERLGKGELDLQEHSIGLEEFNRLFLSFNRMKEQVVQLMSDVRDSEQMQKKLELDKLYYQINPHFLMNTLNSVHWMAAMKGQTEIDTFISQLNYILSYSLGKTDRKATLRTELKVLELYVELQKQRYDFQAFFDIQQGDYLNCPTARLILQPLAENAICHNIDDFGNLWIKVQQDGQWITITIRDDGQGFVLPAQNSSSEKNGRSNSGIGLQYVRMSLNSYYGDRAAITLQSEPGSGTMVTLRIPFGDEWKGDPNV